MKFLTYWIEKSAVTKSTRINDEIMDIYRIETASLGTNRAKETIIDNNTNDELPEVSFDSGPEFNLNFFGMPFDSIDLIYQ